MKVSEVSQKLFEGILPFFESHQFRLNKNNREFKRKNRDITQIVDFYFNKNHKGLSLEPKIRIKVKLVEDVYRQATIVKSRPFLTLGNHLFEILRYIDKGEETGKKNIYDWSIEKEEDINKLIEVIPEYLEETILPYFKENSSLSRVDYLLNKYPRELSIHNYLYPLRANLAIIAAKLNNNPRYEELIQIYEEELQEAAEDYKEEFYRLKKILDQQQY